MYIDRGLLLSETQAITATALATTKPDLGAIRDIGKSHNMWLVLLVTTTFVSAGATTLDVDLVADDNVGMSSPATLQKLVATPIPKASLVQGFKLVRKLDPGAYEQFIGLNYTVATGPFTAGNITAFITDKPEDWRSYNDPI